MRHGLAILALLTAVACAGHIARGREAYLGGDLIEAAQAFEHAEASLPSMSPSERAEYGLYRGLTLLGLDDAAGAKTWLAYARKQGSGTLSRDAQATLDQAWADAGLHLEQERAKSRNAVAEQDGEAPTTTAQ